jgi:Aerotolerance regulator N-terminal/CARDB
MLSLGFFNPALLWLAPLAAIPIIIHILNRRRFQKVPWAAMEYLLRALKQNRRRIQMEQWLLLLLRTLAVVLLVFLVSRPQLTGGGLVDTRTHHVVVVDDSASMGQRAGTRDVYKTATDKLNLLATSLAKTSTGDLFTLIRSSRRDKPELVAVSIGQQLPKRIREVMIDDNPSVTTFDLAGILEEARKRARDTKEASRTQYYVITDFRRNDWLKDDGKPRNELKRLAAWDPTLENLKILEVGGTDIENLGVTAVRRVDRLATAGTQVTLAVEIENFGQNPSTATELAVEIDGKSRRTLPVPPLGSGEKRTIDVQHTFHDPGFHGILVSLPQDRYPVDDRRALALEVLPTSSVLVVDGDPSSDPGKSETEILATALDPSDEVDSLSGITPQVIPGDALQNQDLAGFNMIWLCNLPAPTADVVKKLEDYVRAGGGLVFGLGNQVETTRYNQVFYKNGDGLLPLGLTDIKGDFDHPDKVFVADPTHPAVKEAADFHRYVFANLTQIKRYIATAEDATAAVSVVLRVKDARGAPLMVTSQFENGGQVTLITTTLDGDWDELLTWHNGPMLAQAIHRYAVKVHDLSNYNLLPDGEFNLTLNRGLYASDVLIRGQKYERTFTAETSEKDAGKGTGEVFAHLSVKMQELQGCGLFDVILRPTGGADEKRLLARNPPTGDSQLQKLPLGDFWRVYPDLKDSGVVEVIPTRVGSDQLVFTGRGEIWRLLALVLLGSLVLETLLAWRFGRR